MSLDEQDGMGRSNEVGSNKLYVEYCYRLSQVVSVVLVDERYI